MRFRSAGPEFARAPLRCRLQMTATELQGSDISWLLFLNLPVEWTLARNASSKRARVYREIPVGGEVR